MLTWHISYTLTSVAKNSSVIMDFAILEKAQASPSPFTFRSQGGTLPSCVPAAVSSQLLYR